DDVAAATLGLVQICSLVVTVLAISARSFGSSPIRRAIPSTTSRVYGRSVLRASATLAIIHLPESYRTNRRKIADIVSGSDVVSARKLATAQKASRAAEFQKSVLPVPGCSASGQIWNEIRLI